MHHRIEPIQDLRGIAVLCVVLFHVGNIFGYRIFSHGSNGVSLFFVISGFIIASSQRNTAGAADAWLFAKKRAARIYAPYLLPVLTMLLLFLITGKGDESSRDALNIIRNLFLVHLPSQSIYPYSWSLVYELYFYVTFGILVLLCRLDIFIYSGLILFPCLLAYFLGVNVTQDSVPLVLDNLFFVLGVVFSAFFYKVQIRFASPFAILALISFLIFPFFWRGVLPLLLCTATLFGVYSLSTLSVPWLHKIGNASYSIYLTHAIVLVILKAVIADRSWLAFIIFLGACLAVGWLYYIYLEKPLTRYAQVLLKVNE